MREDAPCPGAIAALVGRGEGPPAADFAAELEELLGRRYPTHLQAVVVPPSAEEGLVGERRILEIPRMLMDLVVITDT